MVDVLITTTAARLAGFMLEHVTMPVNERDRRLGEMLAGLGPEDQAASIAEAEAMLQRVAADAAAATEAALRVIALASGSDKRN